MIEVLLREEMLLMYRVLFTILCDQRVIIAGNDEEEVGGLVKTLGSQLEVLLRRLMN